MPFEKLFLQTDKSVYAATDTVWFKAFVFNGLDNSYSPLSGLIYIELISANKVVQRIAVPANIGLSWGQLALNEKTFEDGTYTLRAYTNWMKNFDTRQFFTKEIYISNFSSQPWLINRKQKTENINDKMYGNTQLIIKPLNSNETAIKTLKWTVQEGNSILAKGSAEPTATGKLDINFPIPEKVKKTLQIYLEEPAADKRTVIPVLLNMPRNIDLQFMPEGGYLVAGVRTKVGFKAIAENGLGTDVEGTIVDSKGNVIMPFKSAYKGMGFFTFAPLPAEIYTAKLKFSDGTIRTFNLPPVKTSGINMRVINTVGNDSVHVTVNFSTDLVNGQQYQLIGLVNNVVYCQANIPARGRVNMGLPKSNFPSGIVHFTVFNSQSQPVCERATFVYNNDALNITAVPSKGVYKPRDSVGIHINLKDKNGVAVPAASLSVAVTDDNLVKPDNFENNIISDVLLTSGLNGNVETPAYYFSDNPNAAADLDALLLTQAWVRYNWTSILKPQTEPLFKPEPKFALSGSVTNYSNKPAPGSKVLVLMNGKTRMIADTITDANGFFKFKNLPRFDTASFFVQARSANGKRANVILQLNEFTPPALPLYSATSANPWYVNSDTAAVEFAKNQLALQRQKFSLKGNNLLKDVVINATKKVKNSHNLNNSGEADQVIDEEQIAQAGAIPLLTFLLKNVKGLYLRTTKTDHVFYIESKKVNFVVDGLDIRTLFAGTDSIITYEDLQTELNNITIKDVTGIEIMTNNNNTFVYDNRLTDDGASNFGKNAYVEITTRSGKGLLVNSKQNIANYKPVPINWPKEFYSPHYTAKNKIAAAADLRSTIFWKPHLSVSANGNADVSFFTADKPGTYTIIIQGSNLKGSVGYKRMLINIK